MSRKTNQTATVPTGGAQKLSAFHVGHQPTRTGKHEHHDPRHDSTSNGAVRLQEANIDSNGDAVKSASSDEEADGEDGESDGAQKDDGEDGAEDPDVKAPSDCATGADASQAGLVGGSRVSGHDLVQNPADHANKNGEEGDTSNDEGYGGVDLISDSERDGSDMDCVEERAIIDAEGESDARGPVEVEKGDAGRGRAQSESSQSSWAGFDFGDGDLTDRQDFFDEQFNRTDLDSLLCDENILGDVDMFADANYLFPSSPPQRRVRFAEPLLEDSPAIPQAPTASIYDGALPPASTAKSGVGAINNPRRQPWGETNSDDESGSSSGYETDYGETTDEDDVPASATARPQSLMRRPSASLLADASAKAAPKPKQLSQRWGPRMGSWCIDPTKPLAIVDSCGKKILVCPARRPKKPDRVFEHILGSASTSANTSPRTQLSTLATLQTNSEFDPSDFSGRELASPLFGTHPAPDFGITADGVFPEDTDDATFLEDNGLLWGQGDDDDDDHEHGIKMEDLIDFGDYAEDSELDLTMDDSRPPSSSAKLGFSGVGQSSSQSFLDHLDTTGVTAFRQTQLPAPASLSPQSPLKKRKLSPPMGEPSKRRLLA